MSKNNYFDDSDRAILEMINASIDQGCAIDAESQLFNTTMHPHGIINMTTTHEFRTAKAVINLLGRLECNVGMEERLTALRALYDEVINSAQTPFRINTGRVLIQIMKDIIRARGDEVKQLMLIHDFRKVAAGNPRIVRSFLSSRFLLEMPEAWDQITFDQHVHDSNTKGRKNPTHLIMDAWIKGIRSLTVIYYNFIEPKAAYELMHAAEIMNIKVRIGLEYRGIFQGRYVPFIWAPRGFSGIDDVLDFFQSKPVQDFFEEGKKASDWIVAQNEKALGHFVKNEAPAIAKQFEIDALPNLNVKDFRTFVGEGRASLQHLAEFIHQSYFKTLKARAEAIKAAMPTLTGSDLEAAKAQLKQLDAFTPDYILAEYLNAAKKDAKKNPAIATKVTPQEDDRPLLMQLTLEDYLERLTSLRSGYRTVLQLAGLTAEDFLEILWKCKGLITHIERFNMKDYTDGQLEHLDAIGELQYEINNGKIVQLKATLMRMIEAAPKDSERVKLLTEILDNITTLIALYAKNPLCCTFGTDSTGHAGKRIGMGLAVLDTLPSSAQKKKKDCVLPVEVHLNRTETYHEEGEPSLLVKLLRKLTGRRTLGMAKASDWDVAVDDVRTAEQGNIVTIGGRDSTDTNGFEQEAPLTGTKPKKISKNYLRTPLLNFIKVMAGFIPAFCTFMLTQHWWVLAVFGAPIWLGITGGRNIIQMIIASGSFSGTRIRWYQSVQWTRLCESLMYTGWSVVLLEGITRNCILSGLLNINVTEYPLLVFTVIALTNGTYISSHNIFRGFPMTAVVGNFFRSVLAIPVALLYNTILALIIPLLTTMPVAEILIPSSAIVTKFASDTIALIIEATADRRNFYRIRKIDYSVKIRALFDCYAKIEALYPQQKMLDLLEKPKNFFAATEKKAKDLQTSAILHLLDLMYFWFYQPSSHQEFKRIARKMTADERLVFLKFNQLLREEHEISEPILQGIIGDQFRGALAFFLNNNVAYLNAMERVIKRR